LWIPGGNFQLWQSNGRRFSKRDRDRACRSGDVVVLGLGAIALSAIFDWRWTGNRFFRAAHFAIIAFVMFRLVVGAPCPLSEWEDQIRGRRSHGIIARLAFRRADEQFFRAGCAAVFVATLMLELARRCARYN
jgi:hypothetical protein